MQDWPLGAKNYYSLCAYRARILKWAGCNMHTLRGRTQFLNISIMNFIKSPKSGSSKTEPVGPAPTSIWIIKFEGGAKIAI